MTSIPWRQPDESHNQRRPGGLRLRRADLSRPFLTTTPGLALRWVVSRDAVRVQAELPGCLVGTLEQVLADPSVDLVVIATPNDTHAPSPARRCWRASTW